MSNEDWKRLRGIFKRANKHQLVIILREIELMLLTEKK